MSLATPIPLRNDPSVEAAFEAAPPEVVVEILDGELFTQARPRPRHSRASSHLGQMLAAFDRDPRVPPTPGAPGGWVVLDEPELHLGRRPDKVVPDLAGWKRQRFPADEIEATDAAGIAVAPDWVCEVLSDATEAIDRGRKRRIYRREGVEYLWYVDPREQTMEAWRLVDGHWVELDTFEGDGPIRAAPFDAIEMPLGELWRW